MYKAIEEMSLNAWPALQTQVLDGWLLRTAEGYTKRSNSVSPIYGDAENDEEVRAKIRFCEDYYRSLGQKTIFKISPFVVPARLDGMLEERGYRLVDETGVRLLDLDQLDGPSTEVAECHGLHIRIVEKADEDWLEAFNRLNGMSAEKAEVSRKILGAIRFPAAYATLYVDGTAAACGLVVVQGAWCGLYDIVTGAEYRNRGYGVRLIHRLLQWAIAHGAEQSYLQVVRGNRPAERLYDKLGYREVYRYWYRVMS